MCALRLRKANAKSPSSMPNARPSSGKPGIPTGNATPVEVVSRARTEAVNVEVTMPVSVDIEVSVEVVVPETVFVNTLITETLVWLMVTVPV